MDNREKETIMIVDDEDAVRAFLRRVLASKGYHCLEAHSGEEAIDKLKNNRVELVLLDIKMPGKSGLDILSDITGEYPDTAVVMASSITEVQTAINCIKHGAYDYLTKPFEIEEVLLNIDRALERRRLELDNRDYRQHLKRKIDDQTQKIRTGFINAITSLVYALEAIDSYTTGHSRRVAELGIVIAEKLGLSKEDTNRIWTAGLVHDIGKIGISDALLNTFGIISDEEYKQVVFHAEISERILKPIVEDPEVLRIIRHHHEHCDGSGFPDGLAGEAIPPGSRIIAVADAYLTLRGGFDVIGQNLARAIGIHSEVYSNKTDTYNNALSHEKALFEIKRASGIRFDPAIVEIFLNLSWPALSNKLDLSGQNPVQQHR
jgi:putative two-component system response regulator